MSVSLFRSVFGSLGKEVKSRVAQAKSRAFAENENIIGNMLNCDK
jgi:hypothetical protein